jgi:hypothetical protein
MISSVVTPPAGGYTTLAIVKARLGIETADTSSDDILNALIDSSTSFINGFCKREMRQQTVVEMLAGTGETTLNLQEWPIGSLEYVKVYDTEVTDYSADVTAGVLYRTDRNVWQREPLYSPGLSRDPVGDTDQLNTEVKYQSGYASDAIPGLLSEAAILFVTSAFNQVGAEVGITQKREGDLSVSYGFATGALGYLGVIQDTYLRPFVRFE